MMVILYVSDMIMVLYGVSRQGLSSAPLHMKQHIPSIEL